MLTQVKYAFRQLRKSPGFTLTAVLTLALGIGANAVVFSVLNALILHPLRVPHAQNLYMVERGADFSPSQSYPDYLDLRSRNRTFQNLFAYRIVGSMGLDTGGNPTTIWPYEVSSNYFEALGIQPYLGRFFRDADEHGPNSVPYVVLSYAYWNSHFQADASAVGRTVQINKHPFTILGVAPPDFRGTELFFAPPLWLPMIDQQELEGWNMLTERGDHGPFVGGRLRPGVTPQQVTADLNAVGAWLSRTYPKEDEGTSFSLARPGLLGDMLGRPARAFMTGVMLLAGLILLAACANLGSLFAARAADRSRDIAVRMALGAARGSIVRQLLNEAILVALIGGAVGLLGGLATLRWISAWQPIPDIPINVPINPDWTTYTVALLLALISGLLFGLVPVRQVLRSDPYPLGLEQPRQASPFQGARPNACLSNLYLRGAGHLFPGCGSRPRAFAAQRLRLRSAKRHAAQLRSQHGWLYRQDRGAPAAPHARRRCHHPWSYGRRLLRSAAACPWLRRFVLLRRQHIGLPAEEQSRRCHAVQRLSRISRSRRHPPARRPRFLLA